MTKFEVATFTSPVDPGSDADRLRRRTLWLLPSGLYVIGSRAPSPLTQVNMMTANLVVQVAQEPKIIAASLESTSTTLGLVRKGGSFSLSVLATAERAVIRRFVKAATDIEWIDGVLSKIGGEPVHETPKGLPVLDGALAWIECTVVGEQRFDSHVVVFGEVTAVGSTDDANEVSVLSMADTKMNYGG